MDKLDSVLLGDSVICQDPFPRRREEHPLRRAPACTMGSEQPLKDQRECVAGAGTPVWCCRMNQPDGTLDWWGAWKNWEGCYAMVVTVALAGQNAMGRWSQEMGFTSFSQCLCRCAGSLPQRLLLRAGNPVSSAELYVSNWVQPPLAGRGWVAVNLFPGGPCEGLTLASEGKARSTGLNPGFPAEGSWTVRLRARAKIPSVKQLIHFPPLPLVWGSLPLSWTVSIGFQAYSFTDCQTLGSATFCVFNFWFWFGFRSHTPRGAMGLLLVLCCA